MALRKYKNDSINFDNINENRNFERTNFGLLNNYVFFIDKRNGSRNQYIELNLLRVEEEFAKCDKKFVYLPKLGSIDFQILEKLRFKFPKVPLLKVLPVLDNDSDYHILDYFGYEGDIECGFLVANSNLREITFYELKNANYYDTQSMISDLVEFLFESKNLFRINHDVLYSPIGTDEDDWDENIEINPEVETEIREILKQLDEIKKKGLLITALPILEKMTSIYNKKLDSKPSFLKIDDDFRILLPEFEMEIKMSHLTKSLYFLFLLIPEGILFENLGRYKEKLFFIYSRVSNQSDLDKLKENVDNLISNRDAFYVHLSRIKSAFYSKVYETIADNYIVKSPKNQPKRISLSRELTNIDDFQTYLEF